MAETRSGDAAIPDRQLLIRGGRIYDHDGDIDDPSLRDVLVQGSRIASVTAPDEELELKWLPLDQAIKHILEGNWNDGKTAMALWRAQYQLQM